MDFNKLFQRAKQIMLQPVPEWEAIKAENTSYKQLIKDYAIPMIVLVLVAALIGGLLFHTGHRLTFGYLIATLLISLLVTAGGLYLSALVINEIVPSFGAQKNLDSTFNLLIYSCTAFFVCYAAAKLLDIFPLNVLFNLCGLYSFYLFFTGTTPILGIQQDRKGTFTLVSALIMIGIFVILSLILGAIFAGVLYSSATFRM